MGSRRRCCSTASTISRALQLDAIETLGRVVDAAVTVSLAYEPGRVGVRRARGAPSRRSRRWPASTASCRPRADHYAPRARAALGASRALAVRAGRPGARASAAAPCGCSRAAASAPSSSWWRARSARCSIAASAPEEIAVVVRRAGRAAELLRRGLRRGRRSRSRCSGATPFADTAIGRALLGLLRCVPPARHASAAELARPARLAARARPARAPGARRPAGARPRARGRAGRRVQARALWEQRHWPLDTIDRLREAQARGGAALIERAARELHWLFCAPRRGARARARRRTSSTRRGALAAGRRALAELRELARSAPELAPAGAAELARALERLEVVGGERAAAPGRRRGARPAGAARAARARAVRCAACRRACSRRRARPQPLLAEEERRRLAEVSGLRLGEPRGRAGGRALPALRGRLAPEELLFLSWHVADDDGEPTPALAVRGRRLRPVRREL